MCTEETAVTAVICYATGQCANNRIYPKTEKDQKSHGEISSSSPTSSAMSFVFLVCMVQKKFVEASFLRSNTLPIANPTLSCFQARWYFVFKWTIFIEYWEYYLYDDIGWQSAQNVKNRKVCVYVYTYVKAFPPFSVLA